MTFRVANSMDVTSLNDRIDAKTFFTEAANAFGPSRQKSVG